MADQPPSVGRTVHYGNWDEVSGKDETQAATITGLNVDGTVSLKVFARTRTFDLPTVTYSETPQRWRWSWPPRV